MKRIWKQFAIVHVLLVGEIFSTKLGIAHSVLIPSPENVFWVFVRSGSELFECAISSLQLLFFGGGLHSGHGARSGFWRHLRLGASSA